MLYAYPDAGLDISIKVTDRFQESPLLELPNEPARRIEGRLVDFRIVKGGGFSLSDVSERHVYSFKAIAIDPNADL